MKLWRTITRLMLLAAVCVTMITPAATPQIAKGETPLAGFHPEVRLRKLHLVRPDLIPYPIAYEVCC